MAAWPGYPTARGEKRPSHRFRRAGTRSGPGRCGAVQCHGRRGRRTGQGTPRLNRGRMRASHPGTEEVGRVRWLSPALASAGAVTCAITPRTVSLARRRQRDPGCFRRPVRTDGHKDRPVTVTQSTAMAIAESDRICWSPHREICSERRIGMFANRAVITGRAQIIQ